MAKVGQSKNKLGEKVIVYGASKTGKTVLVGQLAKQFKLKWVDVENGSSALEQLPQAYQDNIEVAQIPDTPVSPYGIEALLMMFDGRKGYICDEHGKWNCPKCKGSQEIVEFDVNNTPKDTIIVVDSLSQASDSAINQIANRNGIDIKGGEKFEWDHWGMLGAMLSRLLGSVQNCRAHVVFITHEQEIEQEDGKEKLTAAGGTTKFARKIPKFFGHVVRGDLLNGKHKFVSMTKDAKNFIAGSRTNVDTSSSDLIDIFINANKNLQVVETKPVKDIGVKKVSALDRLKSK